jgi:glyoxylase-like metal-dependent hydrolase (beta-lactamase superfamily II)
MYSFTLGRAAVTILDDGSFPFPARMFFANVPEGEWRRLLATDAQGQIAVGHNYPLVDSCGRRILVDTGYGDDTHGGRTGRLLDELARAGCARNDVDIVVNTHAHGDHTGRNMLDGAPAFPNARYYLARADWDHFSGLEGRMHHFARDIAALARHGVLSLVDGALALTPEVSLLPTPGHTPGHLSVVVESAGRLLVCMGDVCHHALHFSHPDWVSCFDTDPRRTPVTRARLFGFALAHDALLLCPHLRHPGLGRLTRTGNTYAWRFVSKMYPFVGRRR